MINNNNNNTKNKHRPYLILQGNDIADNESCPHSLQHLKAACKRGTRMAVGRMDLASQHKNSKKYGQADSAGKNSRRPVIGKLF